MLESTSENRRLMTRGEVADLLRVHPTTVSRWVKHGEIGYYRIGGRVLFRSDDVWAFFEKHRG
ncbi:hypothetical protein DSCW_63820 [Desulfosarcina widdelii]|uniref:Helix-turn-helix domain-containing protein n=2 Tax=Desulfosarcina widdelii TaxID=947919 RepID=A0A5K7ZDW8_9BACT|nr:hypothetical protein DSCW_63820 [Desulfosarcina widdelii]